MNILINKIRDNKKSIFFVLIAVQILLFYCYEYGDLVITTEHGISFWDCLFSGKIRDFYAININTELHAGVYYGQYFAAYDFVSYIIFGIWNFPLWIAKQLFGVQYPLNHLWANMWAKTIVLVFYAGCIYFADKIMKLANINEIKKYIVMISTSAFVFLYIVLMGQYDVICIFFILWGIYSMLSGKRIQMLIAFSVAVPIKILALIIFVPALLYFEKNILKIVADIIIIFIPMFLFRIIIPFAEISNTSVFFERLFSNSIDLGYTKCSVFLMTYILFLICCYIIKLATEITKRVEQIVYLCFVSFVIFIVFVFALPYWTMYLVPFLYMIYIINSRNRYINLILEICMSFSLVFSQILYFYHTTSGTIVGNMILKKVFNVSKIAEIAWQNLGIKYFGIETWNKIVEYFHSGCWAIFISSLLVFLYLNFPWKKNTFVDNNKESNRIVLYVARVIAALVILITPLCGIFY